jgi:hypothetical protein
MCVYHEYGCYRLLYLVVGDIACVVVEVDGHVWQSLRGTIHDTRRVSSILLNSSVRPMKPFERGANLRWPAEPPAAVLKVDIGQGPTTAMSISKHSRSQLSHRQKRRDHIPCGYDAGGKLQCLSEHLLCCSPRLAELELDAAVTDMLADLSFKLSLT